MTEQDWLASQDPGDMLRCLAGPYHGDCALHELRAGSGRKLRLFACACCRMAWDRLTDERSRKAVEAMEQAADDKETAEHSAAIVRSLDVSFEFSQRLSPGSERSHDERSRWNAADAVAAIADAIGPFPERVDDFFESFVRSEMLAAGQDPGMRGRSVPSWSADLLRHIIGNPFRPPVTKACERCHGIKPFPHDGHVMIYAVAEGSGPVGPKHGNRFVGWRVMRHGKDLSPIFKRRRQAEQWAESAFMVQGWEGKGGAHHQTYAIPKPCSHCLSRGWIEPSLPRSGAILRLAEALYAGEQDAAIGLHDELLDAGASELAEHFAGEKCRCCGGLGTMPKTVRDEGRAGEGFKTKTVLAPCDRTFPRCKGGMFYPPHPKGCWAVDLILGKGKA